MDLFGGIGLDFKQMSLVILSHIIAGAIQLIFIYTASNFPLGALQKPRDKQQAIVVRKTPFNRKNL